MFFVLAKTVGFFALPSNVMIMIGLLGVVLAALRRARAGGRLIVASIMLLAIAGFSPLPNALMLPLEDRFPPWDPTRGAPAGIVVLGGAIDSLVAASRAEVSLNEAAERMTAAVALARRYPQARVLFSGGSGQLIPDAPPEGPLALQLFEELGVARDRLTIEARSRDTAENARFSRQLVDPMPGERWLLWTSAHLMPRAIGAFRRAGFAVEAYPVDYRTRGRSDLARPFFSLADGLRRGDTAMREWVGLGMYWLADRTSALFPEP